MYYMSLDTSTITITICDLSAATIAACNCLLFENVVKQPVMLRTDDDDIVLVRHI